MYQCQSVWEHLPLLQQENLPILVTPRLFAPQFFIEDAAEWKFWLTMIIDLIKTIVSFFEDPASWAMGSGVHHNVSMCKIKSDWRVSEKRSLLSLAAIGSSAVTMLFWLEHQTFAVVCKNLLCHTMQNINARQSNKAYRHSAVNAWTAILRSALHFAIG